MCRLIIWIFALAYVVALFLLAVGTFGWFGQAQDPLSGVFLMPLGLPWIYLFGTLAGDAGTWLAVLAPLLNLAILGLLCARLGRRP